MSAIASVQKGNKDMNRNGGKGSWAKAEGREEDMFSDLLHH